MRTLEPDTSTIQKEVREVIPAENITHHLLFQGVDEVEDMIVREDYRDYLERRLKKVDELSRETVGLPVNMTSEEIIDELRFWQVKDFIWPSILHNNEGGLVFAWSVYYDHIRFERSAEGYYSIRIWNTDKSINNGKRILVTDESWLNILLPITYQRMITSLEGKDWKQILDPRTEA